MHAPCTARAHVSPAEGLRSRVKGGNGHDTSAPSIPGPGPLLGSSRSAGPAQPKDTLTVALVCHAPTLDPHMHFERVGILVNINMFDSLLHRNAKLEYEPSLATSWKALNDTDVGVQAPQGRQVPQRRPMTAEDVKYSFDRVLEPGKEKKKSPQYGNIRAIKEVKIVDADTVHLITDKPFPLLLERLVFFPHRAEEAHREGRRRGVRHHGHGGHRPLEARGVEARPAHPARGLRRALARQAAPSSTWSSGRSRRWPPRWPSSRRAASTSSATSRPTSCPTSRATRRPTISTTPDPARALRLARHAERAVRQEGRAPGGELRHRQAGRSSRR